LTRVDSLVFAQLPDKIKKRDFTAEEQECFNRRLRVSVILDAADEAVYKVCRRATRPSPPISHLFLPDPSDKMEFSIRHEPKTGEKRLVPDSFYDSFGWLDRDDELDLSLYLDNRESIVPTEELPPQSRARRPSFRRHLSISKIPFGRPSLSGSRPSMSRDVLSNPTSPLQSPSTPAIATFPGGVRRRGRGLSLITAKDNAALDSNAVDAAAAHYQDPEARLKLRVYLASPQKFDEAIEFGFPSADVLSSIPAPTFAKDSHRAVSQGQPGPKVSQDSPLVHTFLDIDDDDDDIITGTNGNETDDDDNLTMSSDQQSVADPDSPKTPQPGEKASAGAVAIRPVRVSSEAHGGYLAQLSKPSDGGYAQFPASSRDMTLRMTLTRPDLRASEDQIYGWQQKKSSMPWPRSHTSHQRHWRDESSTQVNYIGGDMSATPRDKFMMGPDWPATPVDGNVVKRIWNRVRRN
jgi:hypothetical protein